MTNRAALALLIVVTTGTSRAGEPLCPGSISSSPVNGHGLIWAIDAVDDLVVTVDQRGITTWSLADPARPTQTGFLEIGREWLDDPYVTTWKPRISSLMIHPSGDWACLIPTFDCFDLRNPSRPKPYRWNLDEWPDSSAYTSIHFPGEVAISRERLAMMRYDPEIWLLDVSRNSPTEWVKPEAWADRFGYVQSVTFAGDVLLVLEGDKKVTAWDVTDPAHPVEVGSGTVNTPDDDTFGWQLRGHSRGAVAFYSQWGEVQVVAVSTAHLPQVDSVNASARFDWCDFHELRIAGDHGVGLVQIRDSQTGVRDWYLAHVALVEPLAIHPGPVIEVSASDIAVAGDYIVTTPDESHIDVYRTGNQITFEGATPAVGEAWNLAVEEHLGVLANGRAGITVLDLTVPERPVVMSTLEIDNTMVLKVELRDSIAYLLTNSGLATVDLTRPAAPELIATSRFSISCCDLAVDGGLAAFGHARNCTWTLFDVSDPANPQWLANAAYCDPSGSTRLVKQIDIIGDIAYVQAWKYLYRFDIADPGNPVMLSESYDQYLNNVLPDRDYLLAGFGYEPNDQLLLCDIADDGTFLVGRDYDGLPGSSIRSTGSGLVAASNFHQQTLVDFADMVEPAVYQAPMGDMSRTVGVVVDDVWLRPARHKIDLVSLECRPPEASFRWAGAGSGIWFEDTSRYQVTERLWNFGDGTTSTDRSPFHTYAEGGRYRVSLTVSSGNGSDSVTRFVDLLEPSRDGGRAAAAAVD
jgi:hypothetical protein